ncbi:MAG: sodium:solute symporter [Bacteroidales bacterium]|nr:sodium:solute symporter [Bacteroidales bacterium]
MELTILVCFALYTALLFFVMWLTGRRGAKGNEAFFRAGRRSPWPVVAYGMIGASLSGVTFMSVPGGVYAGDWTYMPLVFGYVLGYAVIALVLLPLYYRLNLTSIYTYLDQRFGLRSEKTGALFFILSRLLGSALRMYLVVFVLYEFVFRAWGIPFWVPAVVFIAIILLYTFRSGIKTVVWTDMLQTTFLLLAAIATVVAILNNLDMGLGELLKVSADKGYTRMFETDPSAPKFWVKQVVAGMFITITMTGLDQDMMQKNLTCKSLRDAQKNVMTSSLLFIVVNILFLSLGAALLAYAAQTGFALPVNEAGAVVPDKIFPSVAFSLSGFTAVCFVLGMVAAGYSSADGTLTALTTTFCYDFLGFGESSSSRPSRASRKSRLSELQVRRLVHIGFALLYLLVIIAFRPFHRQSLIDTLFDVAGFTYGPLLGLYAFGLFTRRKARDRWVPFIAVASPVICYVLKLHSFQWFGYRFGFELLLLNGLITFALLWLSSLNTKH